MQRRNDDTIVQLSTMYGEILALWEGPAPLEGAIYSVELDWDDPLVWAKDITLDDTKEFHLSFRGDTYELKGVIDSVDYDGYTALRIGDSLISILTNGRPFPSGSHVLMRTKEMPRVSVVDYTQ